MADGAAGALQLAALFAICAGLALLLGSLATEASLRRAGSAWQRMALARVAGLRRAALVGTPAAMVLAVWAQAAVMGEVPLGDAGNTAVVLLRATHVGHVALAGLAAWVVVSLAGWRGWPGHRTRALVLAAGVLVALGSRSLASHAAQQGDWTADVAMDALHLLAACVWVGMVLVAGTLRLPPASAAATDRADALRWVRSLSSTATAALAVVLVTGAFKVWRAVPAWSALLGSGYGATLAAKLALVAMAAALGGFNRFRVLPGLFEVVHQGDAAARVGLWNRRLRLVLQVEALVLLLVLLAAALLAGTEPPGAA